MRLGENPHVLIKSKHVLLAITYLNQRILTICRSVWGQSRNEQLPLQRESRLWSLIHVNGIGVNHRAESPNAVPTQIWKWLLMIFNYFGHLVFRFYQGARVVLSSKAPQFPVRSWCQRCARNACSWVRIRDSLCCFFFSTASLIISFTKVINFIFSVSPSN